MTHPADECDQPVRVFVNDAQILTLRVVDFASAPVEYHSHVSADRSQWRSQLVSNIHLLVSSHLKYRVEGVFGIEDRRVFLLQLFDLLQTIKNWSNLMRYLPHV